MKTTKRIICFLLSALMLLEVLTGCASKTPTDEEIYLTKGEFFALFVHDKNLSSSIYSVEEINNCLDGSVEAGIIVEWGLLPEDIALKDLGKPVTKEVVVMVCANFAIGLAEGNIDEIKDSDLLEDPQLVADAYASGFFELENGYFGGQEKMSYADCVDMMTKESNCTASFHFDEDEGEMEIADDVISVDGACLTDENIIMEWMDGTEESNEDIGEPTQNAEAEGMAFVWPTDEKPQAVFLNQMNTAGDPQPKALKTAVNSSNWGKNGSFSMTVPEMVYVRDLKSPKEGDFRSFKKGGFFIPPPTVLMFDENALYKVDRVIKMGSMYQCFFSVPSFEEAVTKENPKNLNNKLDISGKELLKKEVGGWNFSIQSVNGGAKIVAEGDITVWSKNQTGKNGQQMADWRIGRETIHAKTYFSISNFNVDADNLKSFATKNGKGFIKITYDTDVGFEMAESLKFTPDSNRNGGFLSNIKNSRFTDGNAPGANRIKVAKIPMQAGPVSGVIDVYVNIGVDGKITWSTSVNDGGFMLRATNGNISMDDIEGEKNEQLNALLTLELTVAADAQIFICGIVKVIDYDIGVVFELNFVADIYRGDKLESPGIMIDTCALEVYAEKEEEFAYCIDLTLRCYPRGKLNSCAVKLVLDALKVGTSLDFNKRDNPWILVNWHFEDGSKIEECTRGKQKEEAEKIQTTNDDSIELSTYKVIMPKGTCTCIQLSKIPSSSVKFFNTTNSITVQSLNENVVKADYIKNGKQISLETVGGGSTEVIIKAKKGILWWKETAEQSISVTVNEGQTV